MNIRFMKDGFEQNNNERGVSVVESKELMLKNSSFVKTVLMLFVILGHAVNFWNGSWFNVYSPVFESGSLALLSGWVNSFHIYAFTLVSGYIFMFKMIGGGYSKLNLFVANKGKRLLVPYLFVALVWVIPISQHYYHWNAIEIFKKYILCINPSQLWFLWMLFWVFIISWLLWKWLTNSIHIGAAISLFLYCVGFIGNKFVPNIFCIFTALQYMPFFYIGMVIRLKQEKNECIHITKIKTIYWIIADLVVFGLFQMLEVRNTPSILLIPMQFLLHIIGALMAFVVLQKLANRVNWKESKAFSLLSKNSMPVYLFHQQVIYVFISLLNGVINPYLHAGINFIGAMVISLIISTLLMKFKWTRFLIGEK